MVDNRTRDFVARLEGKGLRKSAELPNLVMAAIGAGTWDLDLETYFIHPDDIGGVHQKVSAAIDAGSTYSATYRLCRADPSVIWVESVGRATEFDASGYPKRMVGALRDVTEFVATSQKLAETEGNFVDLVESVPCPMVRCTKQGDDETVFTYISPKCHDILGLSPEEILEAPDRTWNMAEPDHSRTWKKAFSLSGPSDEALDVKLHITTASGKRKHIHVLATPHHRSPLATTRTVLVLDITEQARVEEELRKSREIILQTRKVDAIGSLTGGMAHDFNKLAAIFGNLELLREDQYPAHLNSYISEAIAATLRGRDLIRSLLSFARKAPWNQ